MHRSTVGHSIGFAGVGKSGNGGVNVNAHLNSSSGALDSLPKQFVNSMKTLFDIMDDQRAGFVKLADIEKGWQDDGSKGLPYGVIDSLRKVTPANGLLSFERFCTGLKICLLRNQAEQNTSRVVLDANGNSMSSNVDTTTKPPRPPSAPLLDLDKNTVTNNQWPSNNTAAIPPNNAIQNQRTLSLPQLSPYSDMDLVSDHILASDLYGPPPKPPRSAILAPSKTGFDKAEIRNALQNWQMGVLMNEMDIKDKRKSAPPVPPSNRMTSRGTADGGSNNDPSSTASIPQSSNPVYQKKIINKRREPRRHTLQNGIDNNLLKRLKQFEAEKDVLLQGLSAVEHAREWYLKQIAIVQEKIKFLGHSGSHVEQWSEAHQERLDFQRARVLEINRHLSALQFSWERGGFPSHMNLAVHHRSNQYTLKQSNDSLSQLKT